MFKLKSVELMNWGYIPWQTVDLHEGINVCLGENGSGKSTFTDAIKLILGSNEFSKNRRTAENIHPRADVAKIQVVVDNSVDEETGRRPMQRLGHYTDEVTLCCKLERTGPSSFERKFWVYRGGEFDVDKQASEVEQLPPQKYRELLEQVGVTPTLLRAINLPQGDTAKLVDRNPHELFMYLLDLVGDKDIIERYDEVKNDLARVQDQYQRLEEREKARRGDLVVLEKQKEDYEDLVQNRKRLADIEWELPVAQYLQNEDRRRELTRSRGDLTQEVTRLRGEVELVRHALDTQRKEIAKLTASIDSDNSRLRELGTQRKKLSNQMGRLEVARDRQRELVDAYHELEQTSPEEVRSELELVHAEYIKGAAKLRELRDEHEQVVAAIERLEDKRPDLPPYVRDFRNALRERGIDNLLLAEAIEIDNPDWVEPVEALLGPARLDIYVAPDDFLEAKRMAEKHEYRYYVSLFRPSSAAVEPGSARAVVRVHDERAAGWIDWLNNYRLVKSVDDGHLLAEQDIRSITPCSYVQDSRGGRSLRHRAQSLYCGGMSIIRQLERYKQRQDEIRVALPRLERDVSSLDASQKTLQHHLDIILGYPEAAEQYEALGREYEELSNQDQELATEENRLANDRDDCMARKDRLQQQSQENRGREGTLSAELDNATEQHGKLTEELAAVEKSLRGLRSSVSPGDIEKARSLELKSPPAYEAEKNQLERAIGNFAERYPEEHPGIADLYELKKNELDQLQSDIERRLSELDKLKGQLAVARTRHEEHVKRVFQEVARNFSEMCRAVGAEGKLRTRKTGEDRWELDVQISFEGKEPVSYRSRQLSGGQDATLSLMLLTSAIQLGSSLKLMIFDEHIAHLDELRIRHIGEFFRATGAQYITTAPTTEKLKFFDWTDQTIAFTKKLPGEDYAPRLQIAIPRRAEPGKSLKDTDGKVAGQ